MIQEKDCTFELNYDNTGTVQGLKNFDKTLPTREPDAMDIQDVSLLADGKEPKQYVKFWFSEGRVVEVNHYYDDDTDANSLKTTRNPGVCQICPNSGHLMYVHENSRRWEYANKRTQDAFVNWLTEQHLFSPNEETKSDSA